MKTFGFWAVTLLTSFFGLAAIELNKSKLWGFALALTAIALYVVVFYKVTRNARGIARFGCWLVLVLTLAGAFVLSRPDMKRVPAIPGASPERTGTVATDKGLVRGVRTADNKVEIFAGIPYAKPPVGELRWTEPQEPDSWEGVLEADTFAPMSMQPTDPELVNSLKQIIGYHEYSFSLTERYRPAVSEDSLYVNVWRPAERSGEALPVLVYIHGGSLQTGQPWYGDYSGKGLAREGVIVVNMGYRLGVFGFLALEELAEGSPNGTTGNYGLLDQIKALEWVKNNIASFGGDPSNVTLAGESAGAACVSALCTSPLAKGLFKRAILESSTLASAEPPHSFRLLDEALKSGQELMKKHGAASAAELRAMPAKELVREAYTQHHITVDGYVLTETPYSSYKNGSFNETAVLHGFNSEESGPFIIMQHANLRNYEKKVREAFGGYADEVLKLYPAETNAEADENWAMLYGALFFDYPHYCLNRLEAANNVPVYEYRFSKHNGRLGPWHSGEEIYFYGNIPEDSRLFDAGDRALAGQMTAYFVNFIRTGDPNGAGLPAWDGSVSSEALMELGETVGMRNENRLKFFEILDKMTGWE